jgi:hypothetical protein
LHLIGALWAAFTAKIIGSPHSTNDGGPFGSSTTKDVSGVLGLLKSYGTGRNFYSMAFNSSMPTPLTPFVPDFTQEVAWSRTAGDP